MENRGRGGVRCSIVLLGSLLSAQSAANRISLQRAPTGRKNVSESGECRLNLDCVSGRSITNERFVVVRTVISALLPAQAKEFIKTLLRRTTPRWVTRAQERRAEQRFAAGKRPISRDEIHADLQALPLPSGTVVFVHSSMSRLGYVEGAAATIAAALYEVIVRNRNSTLA